MKRYGVPSLTVLALAAGLSGAQAAEPPSGTWLSEGGEIKVRFAKCAPTAPTYCGTIVWEKQPSKDTNNPDPALRSRPMVGVPLLTELKPNDSDGYSGTIYNPQDGRTYSASVKLKNPNTLELSGCLLAVLCQTQNWTRATETPGKPPAAGGRS